MPIRARSQVIRPDDMLPLIEGPDGNTLEVTNINIPQYTATSGTGQAPNIDKTAAPDARYHES